MASQLAEAAALASLINGLMSISAFGSSGSDPRNWIMVINPATRIVMLFGSNGGGAGDGEGDGEPPASKAAIESMKKVEVKSEEEIESVGTECVICMEEFVVGDVAKEMPCQHKFHGECVEKWLKIHGTCPVCRFKMPVDDVDDDVDKKGEIWVRVDIERSRSGERGDDVADSDR